MALIPKYKTREEIPTELQACYVERDGAVAFWMHRDVEKDKVDEFRSSAWRRGRSWTS